MQAAGIETLENWFNADKKNNIGIITGAISQVFVLDIDGNTGKGKFESIMKGLSDDLQQKIKETMWIMTGSGGYHIYFKYDVIDMTLKSKIVWSDSKNTHSQIMIKADNSYVVAAPSKHPSGNDYVLRQKTIVLLEKRQIVELIRAIDKNYFNNNPGLVINDKKSFALSSEKIASLIEIFDKFYKEGQRDQLVFCLSGYLRKKGISREQCKLLIKNLANNNNDSEIIHRCIVVDRTYAKDINEINGINALNEFIRLNTDDDRTTLDIIAEIENIIDNNVYLQSSDLSRKIQRQDPDSDIIIEAVTAIMQLEYFITIIESGETFYYKDGLYHAAGDKRIEIIAESLYSFKINNKIISEIKGHIIRKTLVSLSEIETKNRQFRYFVNLKNGLFDLQNRQLVEHSKDYFTLSQLPITFDKHARPVEIIKFLKRVLYKEDIATVLQTAAYCLIRDCSLESIFIYHGEGLNGKSVWLRLLSEFLGHENISNETIQDLTSSKFSVYKLFGKLANISADLPSIKLQDTGMLKMLASGDRISAQKKFGNPFEFNNYAKLIFSANKIPDSDDSSDAFYRRLYITVFPYTIPEQERDTRLVEKLTTEKELSGFFNLLSCLVPFILKHGIRRRHKTLEDIAQAYNKSANPVKAFCDQCLRVEIGNNEIKENVYMAYINYCQKNNLSITRLENFGRELKALGYRDSRLRIAKEKRYVWLDVKIVDSLQIEDGQDVLL